VGSDGVVLAAQSLDQDMGFAQRAEELTVEEFSVSGGALLFHMLSKLDERTSVVINSLSYSEWAICSIPDDRIDPRRSALFMARSILREVRDGDARC
jgi:hypothetical protein